MEDLRKRETGERLDDGFALSIELEERKLSPAQLGRKGGQKEEGSSKLACAKDQN